MAIRFSNVTLAANGKTRGFLVCGKPSDYTDLAGWSAYREFVSHFPERTQFHADIDTYLYGGEDVVEATPEEVAYMTIRCSMDHCFLTDHCHYIGRSEFKFK